MSENSSNISSTCDSNTKSPKIVISVKNKTKPDKSESSGEFEKLVLPTKGKKKSADVSEIYKKMSHIEHVLEKPDSYVGSVEMEETEQDTSKNKLEEKEDKKSNNEKVEKRESEDITKKEKTGEKDKEVE